MLFTKVKEKELKMVWQVQKNNKKSFLVGTAHFFPYSFRTSLSRYIRNAGTVLFEGPLDTDSMAKVVNAGNAKGDAPHLLDDLDEQTNARIAQALFSPCRNKSPFPWGLLMSSAEEWLYDLVKGMKPWMAFFTIWTSFLEKRGWRYSVDLEAYNMAAEMGKKIIHLETIEEQIEVLENLSHESIIDFLKHVDRWDAYAQEYMKCYLDGDLENLASMGLRHPSRSSSVIVQRDRILYERMLVYLEQGEAVALLGAPHIRGINEMLRANGYQTNGFWRP